MTSSLSTTALRVNSSTELPPLVGVTPVGETARVEVIREGQTRTVGVLIAELDDSRLVAQVAPQRTESSANDLGVVVGELDDETRSQLQLESGGVLVQRVMEGPASAAGIRRGDAIVRLDNKPVDSVEAFDAIANGLADKRSVAVLVQRREGPLFLALKLDDDKG